MSRPNSAGKPGGNQRERLQEQGHHRSDSDHKVQCELRERKHIYHQRTESEPGAVQSNAMFEKLTIYFIYTNLFLRSQQEVGFARW